MKFRYCVLLIVLILFSSVTFALINNTFSNGSDSINITFQEYENHSRNISLYKNSNFISAYLNLSGFGVSWISNNLTELNTETSCYGGCGDGVDENWATFIDATAGDTFENFTINLGYTNASFKTQVTDSGGIWGVWCYKNTNSWSNALALSGGGLENLSASIPSNCISSSRNIALWVGCIGCSSADKYYESAILYNPTNTNYTSNINININNTGIWNYTTNFSGVNNQTIDFSSILQEYVDGISTSFGNVSIDIHSDNNGILRLSSLLISWNETINPNLSINLPLSNEQDREVIISINASDDYELDYCYFNITRGDSPEKSNTQISNCSSYNYQVSSDKASYVVHIFINDTSGNINQSDKSFYVNIPSGGGDPTGGASPIIVSGTNITWLIQTENKRSSYTLNMNEGQTRKIIIQFKNLGENQVRLDLDCEGILCEGVSFDNNKVLLPSKSIEGTINIPVTIKLPELLNENQYTILLRASDQEGNFAELPVNIHIGFLGTLLTIFNSIFSLSGILAFMLGITTFGILFYGVFKKGFVSGLFSGFIGLLVFGAVIILI